MYVSGRPAVSGAPVASVATTVPVSFSTTVVAVPDTSGVTVTVAMCARAVAWGLNAAGVTAAVTAVLATGTTARGMNGEPISAARMSDAASMVLPSQSATGLLPTARKP